MGRPRTTNAFKKQRRKLSSAKHQQRKRKRKGLRPTAFVTAVNSRSSNEAETIRLGRVAAISGRGKGKLFNITDVGSARPRRGLMKGLLVKSRALGKKGPLKLTSKGFGDQYRALLPNQDELFSTATTRAFKQGILNADHAGKLSIADENLIVQTLEVMSQVRVSTKFVGYSTQGGSMQHPTADGTGLFADATGDPASLHAQLDAARSEQVTGEMTAASKVKGANAQTIAYAGLRRAISFTLNEMMAPILASDVRKFSLRGLKSGPASTSEANQMAAREELKAIYVKLGGTLRVATSASGGNRRGRAWALSQGKNFPDPSPERNRQ